jgi:hypothetical protein
MDSAARKNFSQFGPIELISGKLFRPSLLIIRAHHRSTPGGGEHHCATSASK